MLRNRTFIHNAWPKMPNFNTTLRVGYLPIIPYAVVESDGSVWGDSASKLGNISDAIGINLKWIMPDDLLWGTRYPNGTWDGMLGMGANRLVEIIHGPNPRAAFLDEEYAPSAIFAVEDLFVMAAVPSEFLPQDVSFNIVDLGTGITLLVTLVLSTLFGMAARKLERSYEGKHVSFWSAEILMGYGKTITQEGTRVIGGGWANRIVFGAWMIASFFFMNLVTSTLKTGLLVQVPYPRLKTMLDIVSRPNLKPMMAHVIEAIFQDLKTETILKLVEQLRRHQSWTNPKDMFNPETWQVLARGEGALFATEKMAMSSLPALCPTLGAFAYALTERPHHMQLMWYLTRDVAKEIRDAIDVRVQWLDEHPTRWFTNYKMIAQNRYFCFLRGESRAQVSVYEALNMGQFRPFVFLYLVCCGVSIVSFIGERIAYGLRSGKMRLDRIETPNVNRRRYRAGAQVYIE